MSRLKYIFYFLPLMILVGATCKGPQDFKPLMIIEPQSDKEYSGRGFPSEIKWNAPVKEGSFFITVDGKDFTCRYIVDYAGMQASSDLLLGGPKNVSIDAEGYFWHEKNSEYYKRTAEAHFRTTKPDPGPLPTRRPAFCLDSSSDPLSVKRGGNSPARIRIVPVNGFNGDVEVTAINLPPEVTANPVTIHAGDTGEIMLSAGTSAKDDTYQIYLKGMGVIVGSSNAQYLEKRLVIE